MAKRSTSPRKKLASVRQPTIEATLKRLFRFATHEQALQKLASIRKHFVLSRQQEEDQPSVRLWIQGFALNGKERTQGYVGNFCLIRIKEEDGHHLLYGTKDSAPLHQHPKRDRSGNPHPNWGHPLLRKIKKGSTFPSVEAAQEVFEALHKQYPMASIPASNKLYLMVYSRQVSPPVQKIIFTLSALPAGGVRIDWKVNPGRQTLPGGTGHTAATDTTGAKTHPAVAAHTQDVTDAPAAPEKEGYFTSKVKLSRRRKK